MNTIKIKSNLSKEKEAIEIAKQILKNPILIGNNNVLKIGNEIEIQELKTTITIERIPQEDLMLICNCGVNFEKKIGKKLYTNYGGKVKEKIFCCEECRNEFIFYIPENRYSFVKSKIKPSYLY
jgi:hypothetical protein